MDDDLELEELLEEVEEDFELWEEELELVEEVFELFDDDEEAFSHVPFGGVDEEEDAGQVLEAAGQA